MVLPIEEVFFRLEEYRFFREETDFFDFLEYNIEEEDIDFLLPDIFLLRLLERAQEEPLIFFFPTTTPTALATLLVPGEIATPGWEAVSLASALKRRLRAWNLPKRGEATWLSTDDGGGEGKATVSSSRGGAEDWSSTGAEVALMSEATALDWSATSCGGAVVVVAGAAEGGDDSRACEEVAEPGGED